MPSRLGNLRRAVVAAATLALALSAASPAFAAASETDQSTPTHSAPRFTAAQLEQASQRYTPLTDGTPGLVAAAGGGNPTTTTQPPASGSASGSDRQGFESEGNIETARGAASSLALAGTNDWVAMTNVGTIARLDAQGHQVWHVGIHDLIAGWRITPKVSYFSDDVTPVMYEGFSPYTPGATGRHPFAQADFSGDGIADIAVAYQFGQNPSEPFTEPGSTLSNGTFISVLDGRTGTMLWHVLVPGTVNSLLAQDGKLIAAESTGPSWQDNPVPEQANSRSSLLAYSFSAHDGALSGTSAWTYSTQAPWARWSDIESMGPGRITVGWTDTPTGLGSPRPADGHVLVLNTGTGKTVLDTTTPGYAQIVRKDPTGDRVLVAELNDPMDAVRWDLTSIDVRSGKRTVITSHTSAIPVDIEANYSAHGRQPQYVIAELAINNDLTDGASSVQGLDSSGHTLWTYTTSSTVQANESPILGVDLDTSAAGQVLVAVGDSTEQTLDHPDGLEHSQLVALDLRSGHTDWRHEGAVTGDGITAYRGGYLTVGYDLTGWFTDRQGRATAMPLMGDLYAAGAADVNGDGVDDLIVAGQSHGVFALDGKSLKASKTTVLWTQSVSAAVHAIHIAPVTDSDGHTTPRIVAATSHGFAVLDVHTGAVTADVTTGTFQWDDPVVDGHIIASTPTALGSYTADGHATWTYRPAGVGNKKVVYSVPATDGNGNLYLEYGGTRPPSGTGTTDPAPTAAAINVKTGAQLWTQQPTGGPKAAWIQAQAGTYASPAIPGADGHGVAFAFGGDQASTQAHTVMIVDGQTGKVTQTQEGLGSFTFEGYASAANQGLLWLHNATMTDLPADGSTPFTIRTMPVLYQGLFATAQDGSRVFVAGADGGIFSWSTPLPNQPDTVESQASAFAYDAGTITPLPLHPDRATDLVALTRDFGAYNLNEAVGGAGSDPRPADGYAHGLTLLQATGAAPATGTKAAPPASASKAQGAPSARITEHPMPTGVATAPHQVLSQRAATPRLADDTIRGYTPAQLAKRLGLTGDGTGQTVAITAAYHYRTAEADLNHYAQQFGLPQTCDSAADGADCFDFQVSYADGTQPTVDSGWNEEAALDIETVHAVVPRARIVLVEAADASAGALYRAVDAAAKLSPAAINASWGLTEFSGEGFYDGHCELATSACVESTGDSGYPAGYSSTSQHPLAVGGTTLTLDADGNTISETAWSGTGGGLSYFQARPSYQDGLVTSKYRATPDVSFDADPATGVAVYVTKDGSPYWMQVGGTSLSAPVWSGILAATDQLRASRGEAALVSAGSHGDTLHRAVYSLGNALSDVTSGSNGLCGSQCTAASGYDTVTGLGSPLAGIDVALASK